MTNEIGKALFSKAGELGIPVGFLCEKVFVTAFTFVKNLKADL